MKPTENYLTKKAEFFFNKNIQDKKTGLSLLQKYFKYNQDDLYLEINQDNKNIDIYVVVLAILMSREQSKHDLYMEKMEDEINDYNMLSKKIGTKKNEQ